MLLASDAYTLHEFWLVNAGTAYDAERVAFQAKLQTEDCKSLTALLADLGLVGWLLTHI